MPTEAIKIKVNADELDAKLSKSMQELGAHHDQYGRLLNAEEKYIGSLSQANVRMGYYIDSQGKMRDAAGRLVEGLSAAEKAMRMYIDAHGDVRTAEGEFVRASAQKLEALKKEEEQLHKLKEFQTLNTAAAAQGLAATAQFAGMLGQMGGTTGKAATQFGSLVGTVGGSIITLNAAKQAFGSLSKSAAGAGKSVGLLARAGSLLGGLVAVVGTAIASLKAGQKAGNWLFGEPNGDPAKPVTKKVEAVNQLTVACQRLGVAAKNVSFGDIFGVAGTAAVTGQADLMRARIDQMKKLADEAKKSGQEVISAQMRLNEAQAAYGEKFLPNRWSDEYKNLKAAQTGMNQALANHGADRKALEDLKPEYYAAVQQFMQQDISLDPLKELAKRAEIYADVIEQSKSNSVSRIRAEEALTNVYQKYADSFKVDSKKKLDEALEKAARQLGETSDAYRAVSDNLRRSYEEQKLAQSENYIESLREQMKTPMDRLREEQEKLQEAYHAGVVSSQELERMNQFLRDKYEEKAAVMDEPEEDDWKVEEYRAPQSLEYGSQKLYEVLTQRNQDAWRDKMQSELVAMRGQNDEANESLRGMRDGILACSDIGVTP